jgi:hypothetical protein
MFTALSAQVLHLDRQGGAIYITYTFRGVHFKMHPCRSTQIVLTALELALRFPRLNHVSFYGLVRFAVLLLQRSVVNCPATPSAIESGINETNVFLFSKRPKDGDLAIIGFTPINHSIAGPHRPIFYLSL